jgi:transposase
MEAKKRYTSEEKVMIIREHLEKGTPVSDLSDKYNTHPNAIYKWKKAMFENASDSIANKTKPDKVPAPALRRIQELEDTLRKRDALIAEIVEDNINLKKNFGMDLIRNGSNRK